MRNYSASLKFMNPVSVIDEEGDGGGHSLVALKITEIKVMYYLKSKYSEYLEIIS